MSQSAPILVTGAAGNLGTAVCKSLLERGQAIRATDVRFSKTFPARLELGDLRDELFVHRVVDGCSAVIHLGNHPNAFVGISAQKLLAENVAMNANVFHAAVDRGIGCILFASSVQATIKRSWDGSEPAYVIPYLPLDSDLPVNPGINTYAQSKEFAERMLRLAVEANAELSATSIRFPMLVTEGMARRFTAGRVRADAINFAECTSHLFLQDAGDLCSEIVARRPPGYRQYFPALTMHLEGYPLSEILRDRYRDVPTKRPLAELSDLIDISVMKRDLGWAPRHRLSVTVDR
jgi:nucleoside-diphosphate-sugar epimerase